MADLLPALERRLDLLVGALDRARRYGTGFVAFVIYQAESARAAFENTLVNRLQAVGQRPQRLWFQPEAPPESHDLLGRLLERPPGTGETVFVYGLQHAFPGLLNSLNYRRELVPDHRWRLVFWALDDEVARVMRDAPDFWAFVNQVLDLPEIPPPEERRQLVGALAWAGVGDSEIQNLAPAERRARIALRERLLDELPEDDDARSARADLHYTLAGLYWADRQLTQAEAHARAALELARQMEDAELTAGATNALGVIYSTLPTGDRAANVQRAIDCYREALRFYTPDAAPLDYAMTQNNLGFAYYALPTGDRAANVQRAIDCFQEALRFYTPDAAPLQYATTQNNLGLAYSDLPTGDRAANLQRAIDCYWEALRFRTPDAAPLDYAGTQNNLGNAYYALPTGDRAANLQRAIDCYREALRFFTPDAAPFQYATTQNNLGAAYSDLPTGDRAANLLRAIDCYREALRFRTPDAAPLDYAGTQNNLGLAYSDLPTGDRAANVQRAIDCFQEALRFYTPDAAPLDYAMTQNNLGLAYSDLPTGDRAANLQRAIDCYREALRFHTPDAAPLQYAMTQYNLGLAYSDLPTGDRAANVQRAIDCYREALRFLTPDAAPLDYALTQRNLGTAYYESGQLEQAAEAYRRAAETTPENGARRMALGSVLRALGRDAEAAEHLARARALIPQDDHYNLACLEAIAGDVDAALDHLEKAVAWDATRREWAARDPDLVPLRGHPRFEAIIQTHK